MSGFDREPDTSFLLKGWQLDERAYKDCKSLSHLCNLDNHDSDNKWVVNSKTGVSRNMHAAELERFLEVPAEATNAVDKAPGQKLLERETRRKAILVRGWGKKLSLRVATMLLGPPETKALVAPAPPLGFEDVFVRTRSECDYLRPFGEAFVPPDTSEMNAASDTCIISGMQARKIGGRKRLYARGAHGLRAFGSCPRWAGC